MVRRRREAPADTGEVAPSQGPELEGPEPQVDLRMRGTAEQVKRQLGGPAAPEERSEKKLPSNGSDDDNKIKFVEALRNPKFIIRVKRMTPREFNGAKTNVEVWQSELPMGYQEIQEEVTKAFGGEKYRVAVIDPASGTTIAADTFVVEGDPIMEGGPASQQEMDRVLMRGLDTKSASELTEEALDRRARVSSKMLEVEALEAQLERAREDRKRQQTAGQIPAQDNTRVEELDRKLTEAKHSAELEARDRKHAEEIRGLRELIERNSKPAKEAPSEIAMVLQQMRDSQAASDKRFEALQKQMQDDKMNVIIQEVKALQNKPAGKSGSLLEDAQALLQIKKVFGWGADDADDDDEDDKDDDRPWWERALDKLGGKLGDKLFEKFTSLEERGEKVDREKFFAELGQYTDQAVADAIRARQPRALPAPAAPAIPPAPAVAAALPPPPPPPDSAPGPVATLPPPPPEPTPPTPQAMTIEQEVVIRVGGVLEMIEREIEIRPGEYHWNYEGAYNSLPEAILEKVCAAPDPVAMIDAFAIPLISVEKLQALKQKISSNPRTLAWLKAGHDDLREWFAERLKDPKFDPFADAEEGMEE